MRLRHLVPVSIAILATAPAFADVKPVANPCNLITEPEVTAVLGAPAKMGLKLDAMGMCMFNDAKGSPVFAVHGSIYNNQYDANEELTSLARVAPGKSQEAVSGIGEHAEILMNQQGDLILVIQKQAKVLTLSLLHNAGPNLATRKLFLEQAGKQAASRL